MEPQWRIGEFARRTGLTPELLRAWERRYGLFAPARTAGGYRLYSSADERRVHQVLELQREGHSAAEAARLVRSAQPAPAVGGESTSVPASRSQLSAFARVSSRLLACLRERNGPAAEETLETLFAVSDVDNAIVQVILPVLREIGDAWARGEMTVAEEHYASSLVQSRLLALAGGWEAGDGPVAVLACAPHERHALGLIGFGLILRRRGWRIAYLGPDTPLNSVEDWLAKHPADAVVIAAVTPEPLEDAIDGLRTLASRSRLMLGGAGARTEFAERVGATALEPDPVAAADQLTAIDPRRS